jgi:hypothetical protein
VIDHADRLVQIEDGSITAFGMRDANNEWSLAAERSELPNASE